MRLHREILRLALPSILANITVPLVGMVDIAVVGHLGARGNLSAAALIGGISVGSMLFDMLYWNFGFLRGGTGGLTAQAFGRKDAGAMAHTLRRALTIAFVSGILLIAIQWLVVQGAFLIVKCSPEVRMLAQQYFYIRIWAAPATLSLFAFKGWFIGLQDTVRPMVCDLLVNGVNILLSIGLAFGWGPLPELGFRGVAYGTLIAQWSGFTYASLAALIRYGRILREGKGTSAPGSLKAFVSLNRDLLLRSIGMLAVYIGFTVISARYGDLVLAVSTILMKLLMIFSYFTDGFAYAGEALTGRFIGEGSGEGVRSTIRDTFIWSLGVTGLFFLVYGLGGVSLLRLMTSDTSVVEAGRAYIPWLLLMPMIGCPAFTWDGIFTGATASKDLRNSTLLCAVGFFIAWFGGIAVAGRFCTADTLDGVALHVLMAAYFVHLAIRALYLTLRYPKSIPTESLYP